MNSIRIIFHKYRHILLYGGAMALFVFSLKWMQWKYLITDISVEIYIGIISILFTILGIWIATQIIKIKTKTVVVEKAVYMPLSLQFTINQKELDKLRLTKREYDVLQQITAGYSNAKIAENLYLSLSTIKTHASNLYLKMEVKSRAQAIEKAKRLSLTP